VVFWHNSIATKTPLCKNSRLLVAISGTRMVMKRPKGSFLWIAGQKKSGHLRVTTLFDSDRPTLSEVEVDIPYMQGILACDPFQDLVAMLELGFSIAKFTLPQMMPAPQDPYSLHGLLEVVSRVHGTLCRIPICPMTWIK